MRGKSVLFLYKGQLLNIININGIEFEKKSEYTLRMDIVCRTFYINGLLYILSMMSALALHMRFVT